MIWPLVALALGAAALWIVREELIRRRQEVATSALADVRRQVAEMGAKLEKVATHQALGRR